MKEYRYKRIFIIVADSMGTGYLKDAAKFGDEGANTLLHIGEKMPNGLNVPTLSPCEEVKAAEAVDIRGFNINNGKDLDAYKKYNFNGVVKSEYISSFTGTIS